MANGNHFARRSLGLFENRSGPEVKRRLGRYYFCRRCIEAPRLKAGHSRGPVAHQIPVVRPVVHRKDDQGNEDLLAERKN